MPLATQDDTIPHATPGQPPLQNVMTVACMSLGVVVCMWMGSPCGGFRETGACKASAWTTLPSLLY